MEGLNLYSLLFNFHTNNAEAYLVMLGLSPNYSPMNFVRTFCFLFMFEKYYRLRLTLRLTIKCHLSSSDKTSRLLTKRDKDLDIQMD